MRGEGHRTWQRKKLGGNKIGSKLSGDPLGSSGEGTPFKLCHSETRKPGTHPTPPHSDQSLGMGGEVALEQGPAG